MIEITPRMLKAAWTAFRGDRAGPLHSPGPAFKEALQAALAECDEIERLRAENARLREALRSAEYALAAESDLRGAEDLNYHVPVAPALDAVRVALAEKGEKP